MGRSLGVVPFKGQEASREQSGTPGFMDEGTEPDSPLQKRKAAKCQRKWQSASPKPLIKIKKNLSRWNRRGVPVA